MHLTYKGINNNNTRQLVWEFNYQASDGLFTRQFNSRQEGEAFMQLFKSQLREIQAQKRLEARECAESMAKHKAFLIERKVLQEEIQENERRLRQLEL